MYNCYYYYIFFLNLSLRFFFAFIYRPDSINCRLFTGRVRFFFFEIKMTRGDTVVIWPPSVCTLILAPPIVTAAFVIKTKKKATAITFCRELITVMFSAFVINILNVLRERRRRRRDENKIHARFPRDSIYFQ